MSPEIASCLMATTLRARRAAACAALLVLALAAWRLDDVGPTWDLAHGEYAYSGALLEWTLGGDAAYLDAGWRARRVPMRAPAPVYEAGVPLAAISVPAALAVGVSVRTLWTEWGFVAPVTAALVPAVLASMLLVGCAVWLAVRRAGLLGGVGVLGAMLACPRLVGHMSFDVRHVPVAALTLLFWLLALEWRGTRPVSGLVVAHAPRLDERSRAVLRIVVLGAVAGLALAWRVSSVSLLVAWPLVAWAQGRRPRVATALGVALVAAAVAWLASPDLWLHPAEAWADRVAWRAARHTLRTSAGAWLVTTTPWVVLSLAVLGALVRSAWRVALVTMLALPLLGSAWLPTWWPPEAALLDALVPVTVFASFGVVALRDAWTRLVASGRASAAVGALVALALLLPGWRSTAATWPYGATTYAGAGLGEAQRRGLPGAADVQAATVWNGLAWLSEHAELGGDVLVLVGDRLAATAAPVRLRRDLDLIGRGGLLPDPPPPLYVVMPLRPGRHQGLAALTRRAGRLVHTVQVQGALLLEIWQVDDEASARDLTKAWRAAVSAPAEIAAKLVDELRAEDPVAAADLDAWLATARDTGARALLGVRALAPASLRPRVDDVLSAALSGEP